jgi:hypothetical protein
MTDDMCQSQGRPETIPIMMLDISRDVMRKSIEKKTWGKRRKKNR